MRNREKGVHVARARRGQRTHRATQSPLCLWESFWMRRRERYRNFPRRHKGRRVRQSGLCVLFENGTTQTTELLEDQLINTFFAFILGTRQHLPPTKNVFAVGLYNFRYGRVVHDHHKGRTFVFFFCEGYIRFCAPLSRIHEAAASLTRVSITEKIGE